MAAVHFRSYTNYAHWIDHSEVRIFEQGQSVQSEPLAVVPVDGLGNAQWQPDAAWFASPVRELQYVLRAYDAQGQFDETEPQPLWLKHADGSEAPAGGAAGEAAAAYSNYGETGPSTRNIPLGNVGTVKVHGRGVPPEHTVWFAGAPVPVDESGNFVAEAVLPKGMHTVEVAVLDPAGNGQLFLRDLEMKRDDWFYVGIADLTLEADLRGQVGAERARGRTTRRTIPIRTTTADSRSSRPASSGRTGSSPRAPTRARSRSRTCSRTS